MNTQDTNRKLPMRVKLGYSVASVAPTIQMLIQMYFLLYFYVSIVGLSGGVAGTIILIARVWDFINDCIDIISDSEKEISEYVNDRSGSVENDSLGYKWISIDSFCEKNASPLVIKVCELIDNKKSFEIIEYVI